MTESKQCDIAYIYTPRKTAEPCIVWLPPQVDRGGNEVDVVTIKVAGELILALQTTPVGVVAVAKADARTALDAAASSADYTARKLEAAGHWHKARQLDELSAAITKVIREKL
jgi:hypothetical protein